MKYIKLTSTINNTEVRIAIDNIASMWPSNDNATIICLKHGLYKGNNTFKVNEPMDYIEIECNGL